MSNKVRTVSFHILPNALLTKHTIIWHYEVWATNTGSLVWPISSVACCCLTYCTKLSWFSQLPMNAYNRETIMSVVVDILSSDACWRNKPHTCLFIGEARLISVDIWTFEMNSYWCLENSSIHSVQLHDIKSGVLCAWGATTITGPILRS